MGGGSKSRFRPGSLSGDYHLVYLKEFGDVHLGNEVLTHTHTLDIREP